MMDDKTNSHTLTIFEILESYLVSLIHLHLKTHLFLYTFGLQSTLRQCLSCEKRNFLKAISQVDKLENALNVPIGYIPNG